MLDTRAKRGDKMLIAIAISQWGGTCDGKCDGKFNVHRFEKNEVLY